MDGGGGQGGCEPRSEVFVKIQKNKTGGCVQRMEVIVTGKKKCVCVCGGGGGGSS